MLPFEVAGEESVLVLSLSLWCFLDLWQCILNHYMVFSLCMCLCVQSFYSDPSYVGRGAHPALV